MMKEIEMMVIMVFRSVLIVSNAWLLHVDDDDDAIG